MNKTRRHIAFSLLILFLFPVGYKTAHVFVSHHHELSCSCNSCHTKHNNESTTIDVIRTTSEHNHCPICDYVFQINNLPEKQNSKNILIWEYIPQQQRPEKIFLHIYSNPANNRAPPKVS